MLLTRSRHVEDVQIGRRVGVGPKYVKYLERRVRAARRRVFDARHHNRHGLVVDWKTRLIPSDGFVMIAVPDGRPAGVKGHPVKEPFLGVGRRTASIA